MLVGGGYIRGQSLWPNIHSLFLFWSCVLEVLFGGRKHYLVSCSSLICVSCLSVSSCSICVWKPKKVRANKVCRAKESRNNIFIFLNGPTEEQSGIHTNRSRWKRSSPFLLRRWRTIRLLAAPSEGWTIEWIVEERIKPLRGLGSERNSPRHT